MDGLIFLGCLKSAPNDSFIHYENETQFDLDRKAGKISALSFDNLDK